MKHNENKNANGVTITVETKTLDKMQSWALHTYRDLETTMVYTRDGKLDSYDVDGFTKAELNWMIAEAGLLLSISNPDDDERYCVTGATVFESCMGIISICRAIINTMHSDVRSKPGKISVVKTMSEGLKYTDADDWDDF